MWVEQTPKGLRLHIGIFGRRNVGKSSLLNAITRQNVSIVSDIAGTTTDPVEKPMELLPLGPVLFIDTAGIDDSGTLGELRIHKTRRIFDRTDLGMIVSEGGKWGRFEEELLRELRARNIPMVVVFNKSDLIEPEEEVLKRLARENIPTVNTSALLGKGILELKQILLDITPSDFINPSSIIGDLVGEGELAILVIPIDKEAPKGRLILPQVQTIRDLLDHNASCLIVKEKEYRQVLHKLKEPPRIVVTDSQAFQKVASETPEEIPLTSFSILFARYKGDLPELIRGTMMIDQLKPDDRILIAEACTHHPIADDIGRVKIPRWLTQYVGGDLRVETVQGHDFPENLSSFQLVIHCGACMINRKEMLMRILKCRQQGVPITNYGLTIAYTLGIFERALAPFPLALNVYQHERDRDRFVPAS